MSDTTMTWGEFKKAVDAALSSRVNPDGFEIEYIDVSWPDPLGDLLVNVGSDGMMTVST